MPTRKQRRRIQKERRHEYETVWVDEEGNELEEPPEDLVAAPEKRDGNKSKPKATPAQQRGGRQVRVPPPPSWQRAIKRSVIIGVVLFAVIYLLGAKNGNHNLPSALLLALVYTAIFIPAQFTIDRFAHTRWQRRAEQQGSKGAAKKR